MNLNMTDSQLGQIVAKTILDTLTTENREQLLTKAISDTLLKPEDQYNRNEKRTRLQIAFDNSVQAVAEGIIRDQLRETTEFKTAVEGLFTDVAKKLFNVSEHREAMTDQMVKMIIKALEPSRY